MTALCSPTRRNGRASESPRFAWMPSIGTSGMTIYRGESFGWWRDSACVGGMVGQQLDRVTLAGRDAVSLETLLEGEQGQDP